MKSLKYVLLAAILIVSANLNAQTNRLFGARRLVLDNNDLITAHNVYFVDNLGSLGIDNIGLITGTFPSLSALLDLSSTTKGLLPPRMTTAQELAITPLTEGLVLYNLTTHSFDVYNGAAYAQAWTTKGNFGTNPAIDFLGTTDVKDLVFRTSNTEQVRVLSGGNVAIGSPVATSHVQISESGAQDAFNSVHSGTSGRTANFQETNGSNASDAINVTQSGVGKAVNILSNNGANGSSAVDILQNGTGSAIVAAINNAGSGATIVDISSTGTGTGLNITTAASNNLLVVNGIADATVANFAGDGVWDSRINGDQLVTGIQKIGGSIWLDGNSATHQIVTDAPVNVGTKNANTLSLVTNNLPRLFIDGAGNTTINGNLSLSGISAPALPAPLTQSLYLNPGNQIQQTPPGVDIVTGSGTLNTIPMWTPDGYKIGNSIVTQTSNTGISVTPPGGTTDNIFIVNGSADATASNVAGDAVWDSRINGDQLVTGIQKIGGSIWIDGNSATHQIIADNPLNIGTTNGNTLALITGGNQQFTIDGSGNTTINGGNTTINGGGTFTANVGNTTINEGSNEFTINGSGSGYAANINTSSLNGIEVHCTAQSGTSLNNTTHFVDFFDGNGVQRGSIQGQDATDILSDPIYILNSAISAISIAMGTIDAVAAAADIVTEADFLEAPISTVDAIENGAAVIAWGIQATAFGLTLNQQISSAGVAFTSAGADYAEFLKRANPDEKLRPGDIVGVKNGLISKNTTGAQAVYSISLAPIVLGNIPEKGHETEYNKVGFLGQVPVKVIGSVNAGDFIIASGLNDGIGVAVSAEQITPEQFTMVLGRAWETFNYSGIKYVKVAIGLNAKAMSEIMMRQQNEIDGLQKEVNELRKTNSDVASVKLKLEQIEKYLSQSQHPKEVLLRNN